MGSLARGLDPVCYFDDDVFERERARVFAGQWIPVGREDDLREPGAFVTYDLAGDPILVTRTRDGDLAAMANVCRHRSMVMLSGSGTTAAIQCPYHHWTYSLDGTLSAAPLSAALDDFDRAAHCLPRLAVETWQGFVLVNTNLDAEPLAPQVAGLDPLLPDGLAEMVRVGSIAWDQPWNWKITFENYAESYHHTGIHPGTLQPYFPGERSSPRLEAGTPWMALEHVSLVEEIPPLLVTAVYPLLWPSVVGPESLVWLRIEVHGARHSTLHTDVFVPPALAGDSEFVAAQVEAVREVNTEDIVANAGVARGVRSRYAAPSALLPLEGAIAHFHAWYRARMDG